MNSESIDIESIRPAFEAINAELLDALHRAEKTMKERAHADYERYNPLDYDKCLIWVEATMREVRKEIEEASNPATMASEGLPSVHGSAPRILD